MLRRLLHSALLAALLAATGAHALTVDEARAIASGDTEARIAALDKAVLTADEKTAAFIQAMADDAVKYTADKVFVMKDDKGYDPVTGVEAKVPDDAEDVVNNNLMRGAFDAAQAVLQLTSKDEKVRAEAAQALLKEPSESRLPAVERALAAETNPSIKAQLELVRAASMLNSADAAKRIDAAKALAERKSPDIKLLLNQRLADETDAGVKSAIVASIERIDGALVWGDRINAVFSGISLGSVLLLAALGLAITYGLMGVINMAHGELMMIGAYATYVMQGIFQRYVPESMFGLYLVAAIPVSFLAAALVGAVLERGVIRFLYGRPLETLLATWGISLMLQQMVRSLFGAQNVGVENPGWMSGGFTMLSNVTLPWNRIGIIIFAVLVLLAMGWLIGRTRLGLFVRGVTQNRPIASCMGVNTARIDTYAFALGSGIAGLAGCALSQIGNVGPDLGQSYIVDSFMVVVMGGVGQLAGTVYAAMGLGILNKFIEGWAGAVLAKIAVLVFIIIFIQKRPQGIFAMKGRSAEA
ncbi:urea ABC transporter permease subunit UrtB [Variovorax arabinosiphilus]|uniref:urea ABC transporter permease subunit UrtB n=1 Tax=Variovorax arabinosiphilus TaxID=3053498 RepID=UPI0025772DDC|nr:MULTISPECIES: urea ABC transporter permease subunit UrtB [unclassified Variovorax]MDM0120386.1 urea ABC transporter permease subunit UrtB [Variovorax sp. J2L1-78]MDM0127702.1 urea ABC transporter permease subunit UrtB [Variovorax sp. J2L1-63]MDM0231401.1 urea ABC transporter permease subunit UrtB [Variovorax sp. J2R1-6]